MTDRLYSPVYEWFETRSAFLAGTPTRTSEGSDYFSHVYGCEMGFHRRGGCLDARIRCPYELTTHLRRGWFVKIYLHPDADPVYCGTIEDLPDKYNQGEIHCYGFVNRFRGYLKSPITFANTPAWSAILQIVEQARLEASGYFEIDAAVGGTFDDLGTLGTSPYGFDDLQSTPQGLYDDLPTRISGTLSTQADFMTEILAAASLTHDTYCGFFPGPTQFFADDWASAQLDEDIIAVTPLTFQVAQGRPKRKRKVRDKREVDVTRTRQRPGGEFNRVILYGNSQAQSWTGEDQESIAAIGPKPIWGQKPNLADDTEADQIIQAMLRIGTSTNDTYSISARHVDEYGHDMNFAEQGPVLPWSDSLVIKDEWSVSVITDQPIYYARLFLSHVIKETLQIGETARDLKESFGLSELKTSPIFAHQPAAKRLSFSTDLGRPGPGGNPSDIPDPPVGFFVSQLTSTGLSVPDIPAAKYRYRWSEIVGETTQDIAGAWRRRAQTDYQNKTGYLDYLETMDRFKWASVPSPMWRDSSDNTYGLAIHLDENGGEIDPFAQDTYNEVKSQPWLQILSNLDQSKAQWLFVNKAVPQYWFTTYDDCAVAMTQLVVGHRKTGLPYLAPYPGALDLWTGSGAYNAFTAKMVQGVPHSLMLHLGAWTKHEWSPASTAGQTTWDYLMDNYNGRDNIYSVWSEYWPYEVTYDGTPSGNYLPTDYASRLVYMTPTGAAAALAAGYYWQVCLTWAEEEVGAGKDLKDWGWFPFTLEGATYPSMHLVNVDWNGILFSRFEPTIFGHQVFGPEWKYMVPKYYTPHVGNDNSTNIDGDGVNVFNAPEKGFLKRVFVKRNITALTKRDAGVFRKPETSESSVSTEYGYPGPIRRRTWKVRGFDDTHATSYDTYSNAV